MVCMVTFLAGGCRMCNKCLLSSLFVLLRGRDELNLGSLELREETGGV